MSRVLVLSCILIFASHRDAATIECADVSSAITSCVIGAGHARFVGQAFLLAIDIPASGSACPTSPVPVNITWMGHPPRIPVLLGLDQSVIYFVTFCVDGRRHVLDNDDAFAAFRQAIARLDWHIIAAVVMPDHVHLLASPRYRDAAVGSLSAIARSASAIARR